MSEQEPYVDRFGRKWREPTKEELKPGHPVREVIEQVLESWAPNHLTETGRVSDYEAWLERVSGTEYPDYAETHEVIEIGGNYDEFPYSAIKRIAKKVADDLR